MPLEHLMRLMLNITVVAGTCLPIALPLVWKDRNKFALLWVERPMDAFDLTS